VSALVAGRELRASEFVAELLVWLNARFAPDGPPILADTPLFKGGLINSLRILELIAWTEREIGEEIADAQIRTDNFGSATRMAAVFAGGNDVDV
jgi:hypothetical protein